MTEQEVFQRIHEVPESNPEALRQVAGDIAWECRRASRVVLDHWISKPQQSGIPCATLCTTLKELAVAEMLQRAGSVEAGLRVQLMEIVTAQQLAFRELILMVLEPLLKDQRSGDVGGGVRMRSCDAAYLMVRKLVPLAPAEASQFRSEADFLAIDSDERLDEIGQWIKSASWTEIFPDK
jgi:hypothetical protein